MDLNERWREREKERARKRKEKGASQRSAADHCRSRDGGICIFSPRNKRRMEQVAEALSAVNVSISHLRPIVSGGYFSGGYFNEYIISVLSEVKPMPLTIFNGPHVTETLPLQGGRASFSTPEEAVKKARLLMIALVTHEIDEWMYEAGLGPNPHNWPDGVIPDSQVGQLSDKFI